MRSDLRGEEKVHLESVKSERLLTFRENLGGQPQFTTVRSKSRLKSNFSAIKSTMGLMASFYAIHWSSKLSEC